MSTFKKGDRVVHVELDSEYVGTIVEVRAEFDRVYVNWPNRVGSCDESAMFLKHAAPAPKPEKPRAYVAGPMRQKPEFNFPAFDEATAYLRAMGWEVFNPAEHDRESGFDVTGLTGHEDLADQGFDLRKALAADLEYITLHADVVAVLDGWELSSGARAEVATAHALGLTVVPWKWIGVDGYTEPSKHIRPDLPPSGTISGDDGKPMRNPFDNGHWFDAAGMPILTKAQWEACVIPRQGVDLDPKPGMKLFDAEGKVLGQWGELFTPEGIEVVKSANALVSGEVRTTSSTGGQKGVKPEAFSLLPVEALEKVARHYGIGAEKYDRNQWRQGYEWSKSFDALQRHAMAFWRGEDTDHETQSPHMAAVAFHALTLLTFMDEHPAHDDRYKKETA